MLITDGLKPLKLDDKRPVMTMGVFDGLHLGHRLLIDATIQEARRIGEPSLVLSFTPHPLMILAPEITPPRLTSIEQKIELLTSFGVDIFVNMPFTIKMASLSAADFVEKILRRRLKPGCFLIGPDFHFGRGGRGDLEVLKAQSKSWGLQVISLPLKADQHGMIYSSTSVRQALKEGLVELAAEILGRPYRLTGLVVHGQARGRTLGFPTANLGQMVQMAPGPGIYAGWALWNGQKAPAVTNIGYNPTFGPASLTVEVHILDRCLDLYDHHLSFEFIKRLREEKRFGSAAELIQQLQADTIEARNLLATVPGQASLNQPAKIRIDPPLANLV